MLVGLSRECILAARRWKNSRVKCNWPCTSYFLCSPDPIRPLEGLTMHAEVTLSTFFVEDSGAKLLNPREENQCSVAIAESGDRTPMGYLSLSGNICQNNPVDFCWRSPNPNLLFQKKLFHQTVYGSGFHTKGLRSVVSINATDSMWSGLRAAHHHHHTLNKAIREPRPCSNRDSTAPPVISCIFSVSLAYLVRNPALISSGVGQFAHCQSIHSQFSSKEVKSSFSQQLGLDIFIYKE